MDRADRSTPTVRNASRMARRMSSSRATINDFSTDVCPHAILAKESCSNRWTALAISTMRSVNCNGNGKLSAA